MSFSNREDGNRRSLLPKRCAAKSTLRIAGFRNSVVDFSWSSERHFAITPGLCFRAIFALSDLSIFAPLIEVFFDWSSQNICCQSKKWAKEHKQWCVYVYRRLFFRLAPSRPLAEKNPKPLVLQANSVQTSLDRWFPCWQQLKANVNFVVVVVLRLSDSKITEIKSFPAEKKKKNLWPWKIKGRQKGSMSGLWLYARQPGGVSKRLNARQSEKLFWFRSWQIFRAWTYHKIARFSTLSKIRWIFLTGAFSLFETLPGCREPQQGALEGYTVFSFFSLNGLYRSIRRNAKNTSIYVRKNGGQSG